MWLTRREKGMKEIRQGLSVKERSNVGEQTKRRGGSSWEERRKEEGQSKKRQIRSWGIKIPSTPPFPTRSGISISALPQLLLHLRPPPQPGRCGRAPLTITPSPPSPPATTISTTHQHHQHHFPRAAPHTTTSTAPSPSSPPRYRSHDLFFPCCSSLLLTSLLLFLLQISISPLPQLLLLLLLLLNPLPRLFSRAPTCCCLLFLLCRTDPAPLLQAPLLLLTCTNRCFYSDPDLLLLYLRDLLLLLFPYLLLCSISPASPAAPNLAAASLFFPYLCCCSSPTELAVLFLPLCNSWKL
ncbi:hypothetical protein VPH35_050133 [Triticum aestivum]